MNFDKMELENRIRYLLTVGIELNEKGYIRLAHEVEVEMEKIKAKYASFLGEEKKDI